MRSNMDVSVGDANNRVVLGQENRWVLGPTEGKFWKKYSWWVIPLFVLLQYFLISSWFGFGICKNVIRCTGSATTWSQAPATSRLRGAESTPASKPRAEAEARANAETERQRQATENEANYRMEIARQDESERQREAAATQEVYRQAEAKARADNEALARADADARERKAERKHETSLAIIRTVGRVLGGVNRGHGGYQRPCGRRCNADLYEAGRRNGYIDPNYPLMGVLGSNQGMLDDLSRASRRGQQPY